MKELRVTVRALPSFQRLAVALKAELLGIEQFANHRATDFVPHGGQFLRQPTRAFAGPTQRRHRIASLRRFDQSQQVTQQ
jgi:hypothetical protein